VGAPIIRILPKDFCERLERGWHKRGMNIVHALSTGEPVVSIRLNPKKWGIGLPIPTEWLSEPIPWSEGGYYLPDRPTFTLDPLMHAGVYYVQDASSQILDAVLKQLGPFQLGLDLCSAPGGKSQILARHISKGGHLMCNEINRIRVSVLEETLAKWGDPRLSIWNWDASGFGRSDFRFDLILVDAPCSGEGLFRREETAIARWSPGLTDSCARLQQSILNDILPGLAPGGVLIYSTCTLAEQENEQVWRYLLDHGLEAVPLNLPTDWGWTDSSCLYTDIPEGVAFRMLPDQGRGEPFFLCCFRKGNADSITEIDNMEIERSNTLKLEQITTDFIRIPEDVRLVKIKKQNWIVSESVLNQYIPRTWKKCLKPGIRIGGLHPSDPTVHFHESALLSECHWDEVPSIELSKREALWFLSGREFDPGRMPDGYFLVRFKGMPIGWSKRRGRSLARSYPAAWRIRMRT